MGLNWDAAFRNAFETGAGLLADSITRDRNLADRQALLTLNDQMEQQKSARVQQEIINITGGVAREVDDPTHPEGKRQLSEQEYQSALASAFDKAGRPGDAELFQKRADRLRDDERQAKHDASEETWRLERARIEDEFRKGQLSHQQALERMQAATNARLARSAALTDEVNQLKLDEAKEEAAGRKQVRGLIGAAMDVDTSQPGAKESQAFYLGEAEKAKRLGQVASGTAGAKWEIIKGKDELGNDQIIGRMDEKSGAFQEFKPGVGFVAAQTAEQNTRVVKGKTYVEVTPGKWQEQAAGAEPASSPKPSADKPERAPGLIEAAPKPGVDLRKAPPDKAALQQRLAAIEAELAKDAAIPSILEMSIAERKQKNIPLMGMSIGERNSLKSERERLKQQLSQN